MRPSLTGLWNNIEGQLVGRLPADVRASLHIDMRGAAIQSIVVGVVLFIPAILRRLGATTEQVALYHSISYLGLISTSVSVALMRRWGMRRVALTSWAIGRSFFFLGALMPNALGLIAIMTLYSLLEHWPGPAYTQTIQAIYPLQYRARIMALVRLGLALILLAFIPAAGWILDRFGYRVLLPLAGLAGLGSARMLARLTARAGTALSLPPRVGQRNSLWQIVRTDRRYAFFLLAIISFGFSSLMPVALYPIVQVSRLGLSYTEIGLLGLAQSLMWLLGYLFGGRLTERFGGARCLQAIFAVNCLVMLPYTWATRGWMLLPSFIAAGLVSAGVDLWVTYTIIELADPTLIPDYTALSSTAIGARGLVAPFAGAGLLRAGLSNTGLFVLSACLSVVAALALMPVIKPAQKMGRP